VNDLKSDKNFVYFGYADADWKSFENDYEHIEGIFVDVNYLMDNCIRHSKRDIEVLSQLIIESFE
jgi:hypothetical protein